MKIKEDIHKGNIIIMVTSLLTMLRWNTKNKRCNEKISSDEVIQRCNEVLPAWFSKIDHDYLYKFLNSNNHCIGYSTNDNIKKVIGLNASFGVINRIYSRTLNIPEQ